MCVAVVEMRRYDEPITVRIDEPPAPGNDGEHGDPVRFVWRGRLMRVVTVQRRWVEASEWWSSPRVRAARGREESAAGDEPASGLAGDREDAVAGDMTDSMDATTQVGVTGSADRLGETRCWQVEAVAGAGERTGVYQITHRGRVWTLRGVVD